MVGVFAISLSTASATPVITSGASDLGNPMGYLSGPGTLLYDFEDGLAPDTLTGQYAIFGIPSGTSQSAPPAGDTSDYYLSVPNPSASGSATFTFTSAYDYLGLYWGSIDAYNSIDFSYKGTGVGTVTGTMVAPPPTGNQAEGYYNRYVHISGITFDQFTLNSDGYAFEVDNIAVNAVPEPAAMLLFGAGLAGLAAVGRRRKTQS